MTDQQQPAPSYPGFELTSAGLEALHREFGRLAHQAFEAESRATRMTDLLRQAQTQLAPQVETQTADEPPAGG